MQELHAALNNVASFMAFNRFTLLHDSSDCNRVEARAVILRFVMKLEWVVAPGLILTCELQGAVGLCRKSSSAN
jgi:hypothetical protein